MKINQILNEKPNIDSDIVKQRVIRTLQKRQSDDPVFDTAYKLLVGPQLEKRIERQQSKIEKLKEKDRDFRKLVAEVGELKDMSEDEIKLKLNQIYDWNDKSN